MVCFSPERFGLADVLSVSPSSEQTVHSISTIAHLQLTRQHRKEFFTKLVSNAEEDP